VLNEACVPGKILQSLLTTKFEEFVMKSEAIPCGRMLFRDYSWVRYASKHIRVYKMEVGRRSPG